MTVVPLDNVAHSDVRLKSSRGAESGDPVGQVGVFVDEFAVLQREYPILFTTDEQGHYQPVAILGLVQDENLFVRDGEWKARYIPALARRGPLMIGRGQADDPLVYLDLAHPRIAQDGDEGLALFREHGGHAPALLDAIEALQSVHRGMSAGASMSDMFKKHGLVEALPISIDVDGTTTINFENFSAILPEKIAALSAEALGELNEAGLLFPAVMAAHSLGNINALADMKRGLAR